MVCHRVALDSGGKNALHVLACQTVTARHTGPVRDILPVRERDAEEVLAQLLTGRREGGVKIDAFVIYQVSVRSSAYRKGLTCVLKAAL